MKRNTFTTARVVLLLVATALANACTVEECSQCGFEPNRNVTIVYTDGTQDPQQADANGCVHFECGTVRTMQGENGHTVQVPTES